jgi:hypothetical protein
MERTSVLIRGAVPGGDSPCHRRLCANRVQTIALHTHRGKANRDELTDAPETLDYLKTAPWMTDEIAQSIQLPCSKPELSAA